MRAEAFIVYIVTEDNDLNLLLQVVSWRTVQPRDVVSYMLETES